jgi:L-2-hydroxyglutarate oxidase
MAQTQFDLLVVGGGIVGLSTAMAVIKKTPGTRVLVAEKEVRIASHQTGHNSGVIHSGLYYKPGSLKAKTCVEGAAAMVAFCREHGIPYEVCGKVVVATREEELPALEELHRRGTANGVPNLVPLSKEQIREFEPNCSGIRGLLVPGTGITDYVTVSEKYAEIVKANGGIIMTGAEVTAISQRSDEIVIETTKGSYQGKMLVNCAGLHCDRVARMTGSDPGSTIIPFRGEYYDIAPERRSLVKGLIYPVPDPKFPFLGVHFTRRVRGGFEAGPNAVLAMRREGYHKTDFSFRDLAGTLSYVGFWKMAAKYWRDGANEMYRSFSKQAFLHALQRLLPHYKSPI